MTIRTMRARRRRWGLAAAAAAAALAGQAHAVTFNFQPKAPGSNLPAPGTEFYHYTIPTSGIYGLVVAGAAGGPGEFGGGMGAVIHADLHFAAGDVLTLLVGSMGEDRPLNISGTDSFFYEAGGGGGGTFLVDAAHQPLVVAGGGGGGGHSVVGSSGDALLGPDGGAGLNFLGDEARPGGHDGSGGLTGPGNFSAGAGGGFYGDGAHSQGPGFFESPPWGGQAFVNGGAGGGTGLGETIYSGLIGPFYGGYGGGGAPGNWGGGGGGGYSGGSAGDEIQFDGVPGGGGGSFVSPLATHVEKLIGVDCNIDTGDCTYFGNPGDGYASIDLITADPLRGGAPEPQAWALMLAGFGAVGAALRRRAGPRAGVA